MEITAYQAKYIAYELTRRFSSDNLAKLSASLQDARVDLNPHQVDAALFAFKSPLSKGAILADEVGLGKTIEAGIILSQHWAERKRKLLIIAPANLRKQWNQELSEKFYLPSMILESGSFNKLHQHNKKNPFISNEIVICSFQFSRSKADYIRKINWDLVIIDEAHRLRNVYKPTNKIANAIKEALSHSKKVLLTATPLQNSLLELFGLVSIIDEFTFGDLKSFKSQFSRLADEHNFDDLKQRLSSICKRTLRRQVLEYINYTNRIAIVEEFLPFPDEIRLYDLVSEYLRKPTLYALPASQRQLMTLILRKLLASSTYAISATLNALANKLENLIKAQPVELDQTLSLDFETLDELQEEWSEENDPEPDMQLSSVQFLDVKQEIIELKRFKSLADSIQTNSKGEKLLTSLNKGFEKLKQLNAPLKAIIFTESTRTQIYIKKNLESNGYLGKVVLFNGTNNDPGSLKIYRNWIEKHKGSEQISGSKTADLRQAIVDHFRYDATIMVATEAAAEGINLQFCSLVVNYDLPWNPQRIEQRIGRCHRYGQKFDVVVVNFLNKSNAADQRVYQLLDEKFRLFSGVFGASDEILGNIESGVDFEKRIAAIYQNCRTELEIKAAFDQLQFELEPEIEQNIDLTRKKLLENFDDEVHQKLRINLEKGKEYIGRYEQWLWEITYHYLKDFAIFDAPDNSFLLSHNPFPHEKIQPGRYQLIRTNTEHKKSEFDISAKTNVYRIGHSLAQNIIKASKTVPTPVRECIILYSKVPAKIALLENYIGAGGWLQVSQLTISSFETEDHLLYAGFTDVGEPLDPEVCQKLLSLPMKVGGLVPLPSDHKARLMDRTFSGKKSILEQNMQRNTVFFDEEYTKLENWAEDKKISLEKEIKDIDAEIKLRKAEARKLIDLQAKVKEHRMIKELERKRSEKRKNLFEAQDHIDEQKDNLLSNIESRLNQQTSEELLFIMKWMIS